MWGGYFGIPSDEELQRGIPPVKELVPPDDEWQDDFAERVLMGQFEVPEFDDENDPAEAW